MSGAVVTLGGAVARAAERTSADADADREHGDQAHGDQAHAGGDHGDRGPGKDKDKDKSKGPFGLVGKRLVQAMAALALLTALLIIAGIIAVFTLGDDGPSTEPPSQLLGEEPVESDQLDSAAELVSQPMTEAGVEDVQTRFYGSDAERPVVFVARGAVPEDAENPRTVLDGVERAITQVYGTDTLSAARPPGGEGVRCGGTTLPDAGDSTVCAFEQEGTIAAFTLFGVPPDNAGSMVQDVRDQLASSSS